MRASLCRHNTFQYSSPLCPSSCCVFHDSDSTKAPVVHLPQLAAAVAGVTVVTSDTPEDTALEGCYTCVLILLYMCPHTAICVSLYCYICVYILTCVCPDTAICVSSHCYVCVLILLYLCPHTLILLYMCPHTAMSVSSYCYICVLILLYLYSLFQWDGAVRVSPLRLYRSIKALVRRY